MPEIVIHPAAEAEITEAFRWYEDNDEGLGSEFMRSLDATLSAVQRHPGGYAAIHEQVRRATLRRFPYGVFYLYEARELSSSPAFMPAVTRSSGRIGHRRSQFRRRPNNALHLTPNCARTSLQRG